MPHPPAHTVTVTYDGFSPWIDPYTPFVSMSFEPMDFGGTWVNVRTITLEGSISESKSGNLDTVRNNIISVFSVNGRTLQIIGGATKTFNNVFVDSVSFPMSNYQGKLDYSISLRVYDFAAMTGNSTAAPILEPTDTVSADTQSNGLVTISHTVSAKGIDDYTGGSTGMDNAKAFVWARIAVVPVGAVVSPNIFAGQPNYVVMEETENFDRLNSSYSMNRSYLVDLTGVSGGAEIATYTRYKVSTSSSLEADFETVDVDAEYKGGRNTTSAQLVNSVDFESSLHTVAQNVSGLTLSPTPLSLNVDEDINSKMVSVKASFDNNPCFANADYFFDHEVTVNTDYVTGVTKVDVSGQVIVRGDLGRRNDVIDNFVTGNNVDSFLYGIAGASYGVVDGGLLYTLNSESNSLSITRNESKGTLNISASYDDEDHFVGFSQADWSLNVSGSIPYAKTAPSATENGYWSIQYFNFETREKISASSNVSIRDDAGVVPTPTAARNTALGMNASLYTALVAGNYYVVSESSSAKEDTNISASASEERSYEAGPGGTFPRPLISLGVGPPPF